MRSRFGVLAATLIAAVMALLWVPAPGALADIGSQPSAALAYSAHHHASAQAATATERGPPAPFDRVTNYDPDGILPIGVLARSDASRTPSTYDYDGIAELVQSPTASRLVEVPDGSPAAGLSVVPRLQVAAKAAEAGESAATTGLRDAAESCLNSFTADTPVLIADGKEQPIADIKVGDKVLATDPETGRTEARPVVALIRHSGKHTMVDLTFSDGSRITTTDHHTFWDATIRSFSDAIDLHVGDQVLSEGGRTLTITGEHVFDRTLTAYNLQIDGIHTYYAGATPVLVHNSCGPLTNSQAGDMAGRLGYRPTNYFSKGQRVFTNGKSYITQDIDSHSGSLWKTARKPDGFGNRMGTYDYDLNYIGP